MTRDNHVGGSSGAGSAGGLIQLTRLALLAVSSTAGAAISPTNDLPASSPVAYTITRPTGQTWTYTGGTYDVNDPTKFIAARSTGVVEQYQVNFTGSNVTGATSLGKTNLHMSGLSDIVAAPNGYVAAAGKTLYFLDKNLAPDTQILLTGLTSDLTDLAVFTTLDSSANVPGLGYAIEFSTASDNIRRLTNTSGASVQIASGSINSLGGLDLDSYYANNLYISGGDRFYNLTNMGVPSGGSTYVNMNNAFGAQGDFYGAGYLGFVQTSRVDLHNPLAVQSHQILVPEPASLLLLSAGAAGLLLQRRRK